MDVHSYRAKYNRDRQQSDEVRGEYDQGRDDGDDEDIQPSYKPYVDQTGGSYVPHVILATFVCLLFGIVIGFIALIYAVKAARMRASDPNGHAAAKKMGDRSITLSIIGVGFGLVLYVAIGLAVGLTTNNGQNLPDPIPASTVHPKCTYVGPDEQCYNHMINSQHQPSCRDQFQGVYDPKTGSCYFNRDNPAVRIDANEGSMTSSTTKATTPNTQCNYIVGPDGLCYRWKAGTENLDDLICTQLYHGVFDPKTSECYYNSEALPTQSEPSNSTDAS